MGDGSVSRKGELQKVVLENVVTPLIDFLEYGVDKTEKPEENKQTESPESEAIGAQKKTVSEIIKSKVRPYSHPAMKSKMEKTLEQSRCLVLQFINRLISEGMD